MVLDTVLLNTQDYKVRIKDKVEQSKEWSSVVAIEKKSSGHPRLRYPLQKGTFRKKRSPW